MSVDAWGRQLDCVVCGAKLEHPHTGRPRVHCGKRTCYVEHKRRRTAASRAWARQKLRMRQKHGGWCSGCDEPLAVPHRRDCPTHSNSNQSAEVLT